MIKLQTCILNKRIQLRKLKTGGMDMNHIPTREIGQVGLIVKDVEKASKNIARLFGLEEAEYEIIGEYEYANTMYKGKPTSAKAKGAFYQMGAVTIELIEPMGEPSTWNDFLQEKGEGIHHLAWYVKGIEEVGKMLESRGMPLIQEGSWDGGRYKYYDGVSQIGFIIELLEEDK